MITSSLKVEEQRDTFGGVGTRTFIVIMEKMFGDALELEKTQEMIKELEGKVQYWKDAFCDMALKYNDFIVRTSDVICKTRLELNKLYEELK